MITNYNNSQYFLALSILILTSAKNHHANKLLKKLFAIPVIH